MGKGQSMVAAIVHGFLLALGLILPLGVQNVFVFQQGVVQPRMTKALPVVLTASICDTALIVLAVTGVSVIVLSSVWVKTFLLCAGTLFLLYMGWSTWRSKPAANRDAAVSFPPRKQIAFAASVSLLNPHAVLDTVGVIGTSSLQYAGSEKMAFTAACVVVSWLWFAGLAAAGRWTGRLDASGAALTLLNKVSAVVMWGTALYLGVSVIADFQ